MFSHASGDSGCMAALSVEREITQSSFMGRRKGDTPQKAALRQLMQGYLKDNDISVKNGTDVNAIMRDMMSVILEGALDEELNIILIISKVVMLLKESNCILIILVACHNIKRYISSCHINNI